MSSDKPPKFEATMNRLGYMDFNQEYKDKLLQEAAQEFSEEYSSIVQKYGAVEAILNPDTMKVEGLEAPIEYLRLSDEIELDRWNSGDTGLSRAERPLTSKGLRRLAEGQLAKVKTQWHALRHDPKYFADQVKFHAENCIELLEPVTSTAPTPLELLNRPHFLASKLRHFAHNHLNAIAEWSLILGYFCDIEELDSTVGRFGERQKRGALMAMVKKLLDQRQDDKMQRLASAVMLGVPDVRNIYRANKAYDGFTGIQIALVKEPDPMLFQERSLRGALYRLNNEWTASKQRLRGNPSKTVTKESIIYNDLGYYWYRTTEEERKKLVIPQVEEAWHEVALITDLIVMLSHDDEDWKGMPPDELIIKHSANLQLSEKIFTAAAIEKFTKSISSIESSDARWSKLWAEIDQVAKKMNKTKIEEVIRTAVFKPSWTSRPGPHQLPSIPKPPSDEAEQGIRPDKKGKKRAKNPPRADEEQPQPERVHVEPQPAENPPVPYTDQRPITPTRDEAATTAGLSKEKIKTRGTGVPESVPEESSAAVLQSAPEKVVYKVSRATYDTLEQLLVRVERTMRWSEFEKAITELEFSKITRWGSRVAFRPPNSSADPTFFFDK